MRSKEIFAFLIGTIWYCDAQAAGQLAYGSRAGQVVEIVEISDVDSDRATVRVQHTEKNAKVFCEDYVGKPTDECVQRTLSEVKLSNVIRAKCSTNEFSNLAGETLKFVGPNYDFGMSKGPEYQIIKRGAKSVLDGSIASQYEVNLMQFEALCPTKYSEAQRAFSSRPQFVGRWYSQNKKLCSGEEGLTEGLLTYYSNKFVGLENACTIAKISKIASQRYELVLKCSGEGMQSTDREIIEVTKDRLERTTFDGRKSYKFTYGRCPAFL